MKLAIFDVDGTLLNNLACEDACFTQALLEVMGIPALNNDWAAYQHASDAGIALEAYSLTYGIEPNPELLDATITRFVELLTIAHGTEHIAQVAGASRLVSALPQHGWSVAIATGAWRRAAEFKLTAASLAWHDLPIATAEDGPARTDIIQCARARAEAAYDLSRFERVVSIGDGVWDVHAARALGLPFVGIGDGIGAQRLRAAGVAMILSDFSDLEASLSALELAGGV